MFLENAWELCLLASSSLMIRLWESMSLKLAWLFILLLNLHNHNNNNNNNNNHNNNSHHNNLKDNNNPNLHNNQTHLREWWIWWIVWWAGMVGKVLRLLSEIWENCKIPWAICSGLSGSIYLFHPKGNHNNLNNPSNNNLNNNLNNNSRYLPGSNNHQIGKGIEFLMEV